MIEVDRLMAEIYGIDLVRMMENAGRALAALARDRFFGGSVRQKKIAVLAGTGGNGGGALVAARRLANWGAKVEVYISHADHLTPVAATQYRILQQMQVPIMGAESLVIGLGCDLVIDGIIGYNLDGSPRGTVADMIHWANAQAVPTLALDTPSGLSLTREKVFKPAIVAVATLTLALPKQALLLDEVTNYRGELYLADISVPPALYAAPSLGLDVPPLFAESDILRLL